jgi:hypothetical protein
MQLAIFIEHEIEIWAGFEQVVSADKKKWADFEHLLTPFFSSVHESYRL